MPVVELKRLKTELEDAMQFLQSRLGGEMGRKGSQLQIQGVKSRDLKLLLHKFLHEKGLTDYRVLAHPDVLEIVPKKEQAESSRESPVKGVPPFPPLSPPGLPLMSTVYPNYPPPYEPTRKKARR